MNLKLKIKKKIDCKYIIKFMLIYVCIERGLETIGFPHSLIFLLDIINLFLLLNLLASNEIVKMAKIRIQSHLLIFIIGIFVSAINGISLMLVLWAVRNLLRFYIFFGACYCYLDIKDIKDIYSTFDVLYILNVLVLIIQFALGFRQDYLGGIFGGALGANSYSNIFIIIICTYNMSRWLEKKISIKKLGFVILSSFMIAIMTETKILLFEIAIIVAVTIIINIVIAKKYKTLIKGGIIAVVVIVVIIIGAKEISRLYPSISNADFLSIKGLKYILTRESGYTGAGDLNRLTAIKTINNLSDFKDNIITKIFGMGLGSAEYSSASKVLQSAFYSQYQDLHYYWFSHAWMYLECGYIGLIGYIIGFFFNIPYGFKIIRKYRKGRQDTTIVITGVVLSFLSALLYIYNQSLRLESAYLLYFAFASIFVEGKRRIYGKQGSVS